MNDNTPLLSNHVTPPWEEDDSVFEVQVSYFFIDGADEEQEHYDTFAVSAENNEDAITDAVYERLYAQYGRDKDICITNLNID